MLSDHSVLKGHLRIDHELLQERLQLLLIDGEERDALHLAYAAASRFSGSANANQASRERDAALRRGYGITCPCGGSCSGANCWGRGTRNVFSDLVNAVARLPLNEIRIRSREEDAWSRHISELSAKWEMRDARATVLARMMLHRAMGVKTDVANTALCTECGYEGPAERLHCVPSR